MRAMRAEGFRGYQDLKLVDLPKPQMSEGRVLVKIAAAGVTPLEHTILSGGYPRAKAPLVLGSEGAGVVEDANGSEFSAGARVMFTGPYGVSEDGAYSEYVAVREENLSLISGRQDGSFACHRRLGRQRRHTVGKGLGRKAHYVNDYESCKGGTSQNLG